MAALAAQLRRALAVVVVAKVDALGAKKTGTRRAGVVVVLAVGASEPRGAGALVASVLLFTARPAVVAGLRTADTRRR